MESKPAYTEDPETGKRIRPTDNSPKQGDDYQLIQQFARPMTDEEIRAKVDELS